MARKNNLLLRKKDHQFLVQDEMQRRKQRMEKLERVQEVCSKHKQDGNYFLQSCICNIAETKARGSKKRRNGGYRRKKRSCDAREKSY